MSKNYIDIPVVELRMVKERSIKYEKIFDPLNVLSIVKDLLKDSPIEKILVLGLDSSHQITVIREVAKGGIDTALLDLRTLFATLLISNSTKFIMVHNHPSGNLTLSSEDLSLAEKIKKASKTLQLTLLDFVVVNDDCTKYASQA